MKIAPFIDRLIKAKGSDLFLVPMNRPTIKVNNSTVHLSDSVLEPSLVHTLVLSIMSHKQKSTFLRDRELNFTYRFARQQRFRCSAYFQQGLAAMVLRRIETEIPSLESLAMPPILKTLALKRTGLVIVSGATGSGKSTTLAAMVNHRNIHRENMILTIEDPIEFAHRNIKSIVVQREVGVDTESYEVGLLNSLRQAPDMIVIGEIRTAEAMRNAIRISETGHLCVCTVHATDTVSSLDRILSFFPSHERQNILLSLSMHLRGIVSQRLLPIITEDGLLPALEILTDSTLISDQIRLGNFHKLKDIIRESKDSGMQDFDSVIISMLKKGLISTKTAYSYGSSSNEIRLAMRLSAIIDVNKPQSVVDENNGEVTLLELADV